MSARLRLGLGLASVSALVVGGLSLDATRAFAGAAQSGAGAPAAVARPGVAGSTSLAGPNPAAADDGTASGRAHYPGNPDSESALVADEDRRLTEVRTVGTLARWTSTRVDAPYRLAAGSAYTLVLTARHDPYTIKDLLALAPQTFVRQPDGAYLLSEDLVVGSGATLSLSSSGPLTVRMASDAKGFVSIVNQGGRLQVTGTAGAPVTITSWDRAKGAADQTTGDGRAYLRSIGGQVALTHVDLRYLGFWSGRTGGLALTGTDRPNTGALDAVGRSLDLTRKAQRAAGAGTAAAGTGAAASGQGAAAGPGTAIPPKGKTARQAAKAAQSAQPPTGRPSAALGQLLPAGNLPVPQIDLLDPKYSYVSASLSHVSSTGNAYGVFLANANGVEVKDCRFADSLVDGVVFHRYVRNAVVDSTTSTGNGGDGIVLSRATTGIVLSQVDASRNSRNGVTISGLPLADGPSATGTPVGSYGNNSVNNSSMTDNGHYGIEVIGGSNIGINGNDVVGNDMGVVVRDGAAKVSVVGNDIRNPARQGLALRDGVRGATVTGNVLTGGQTGVYVRDSAGQVRRNTLRDAASHGISVVGAAGALSVSDNTVTGRGPSAIDVQRAVDLAPVEGVNDTQGWVDTTPWPVTLKRYLQPLTVMWGLLALLVLVTALRGSRQRRRFVHPYADKAPVTGAGSVVEPGAAAHGVAVALP